MKHYFKRVGTWCVPFLLFTFFISACEDDEQQTEPVANVIKAADGGTVTVPGTIPGGGSIEVTLLPNSVVDEATGELYQGAVTVAMEAYTTEKATADGLTLNTEWGTEQTTALAPYSMVKVELKSADGKALNLGTNQTAKLRFSVSPNSAELPNTAGLFVYNDVTNRWELEGGATLEAGSYVADVPHFSYWSVATSFATTVIFGKVLDCKNAILADFPVRVNNNVVLTNAFGQYRAEVETGKAVEISFGNNIFDVAPVQSITLSPVQVKGVVENQVLTATCSSEIKGRLLNCLEQPVTGSVLVQWDNNTESISASTDAAGNFSTPVPANKSLRLTIVSVEGKTKVIDTLSSAVGVTTNLQSIFVCEASAIINGYTSRVNNVESVLFFNVKTTPTDLQRDSHAKTFSNGRTEVTLIETIGLGEAKIVLSVDSISLQEVTSVESYNFNDQKITDTNPFISVFAMPSSFLAKRSEAYDEAISNVTFKITNKTQQKVEGYFSGTLTVKGTKHNGQTVYTMQGGKFSVPLIP